MEEKPKEDDAAIFFFLGLGFYLFFFEALYVGVKEKKHRIIKIIWDLGWVVWALFGLCGPQLPDFYNSLHYLVIRFIYFTLFVLY